MRTWYITAMLAGGTFVARAPMSDADRIGFAVRSVAYGDDFLGLPYDDLSVGAIIDERTLGKGELRAK